MRKEAGEDIGPLVSGSQGIYRKIRLTSTVATHPFAMIVDIYRWRGEGKIKEIGNEREALDCTLSQKRKEGEGAEKKKEKRIKNIYL